MKKIKKGFLLLLIFGYFILSIGVVCASEDNSTEQVIEQGFQDDILNAPQEINITSNTYSTYFNVGGSPNLNKVKPGDTLNLIGTFTNRDFRIDIPLNIVGKSGSLFKDCSFIIENGASGSNITKLNISNSYKYGIHISASNCTLDGCNIYSTGPSSFNIILDSSASFNNITNNYLKTGSYLNEEGKSASVSNMVVGNANYNYIANNYLECGDANSIYFSIYSSNNFVGGASNFNTIYNNTIRCRVIPTSLCYGIQIYGKGNKIDSNKIIGTYRGISIMSGGNNTIVNNELYNLTGKDYVTGAVTGAEYAIISLWADTTIENNKIVGSTLINDAIYVLSNSIVSGNKIYINGNSNGIHISGDNINITDNEIHVTSGSGIYQNEFSGLFIANNNISATSGTGILIKRTSTNTQGNITIINNFVTTNGKYSIYITDVRMEPYIIFNNTFNAIMVTPQRREYPPINGTSSLVNVTGTFFDLTNALRAVEDGGIINFTGDIVFTGSGLIEPSGILINKSVIIEGNNFQINAQQNALRIFNITENVNVTLKNIFFTGCGNSKMGGAIFNLGNLTIINSTFMDNTGLHGGAIYNNGSMDIINSSFKNNRGQYTGGAIYNSGVLNIENTKFSDNNAYLAACVYNDGILNMDECLIFSNNALYAPSSNLRDYSGIPSSGGGVIYNKNNATINNSKILNNIAFIGGVVLNDGGNLVIENSDLSKNKVDMDHWTNAGGVIEGNGNITLIKSNFTSNYGKTRGGVISTHWSYNNITKSYITIDGCNFNGNFADAGGVIYNDDYGSLNIIDSTFTGNKGNGGSTILNFKADMFIDGSTFNGNEVGFSGITIYEYFNGGAVSSFAAGGTVSSNGANNVIVNSNFINNKNGATGTLTLNGHSIVDNSSFISNTGKGDGGAITAQHITITNSEFIDNVAKNGDVIYIKPPLKRSQSYNNGYFDEEGKYQLVRPVPPSEKDPSYEDNPSNEEPSNPIDEPSFIDSNTTNNDNPSEMATGNSTNVDATPVGEIQNAISVSNEPSSSPSSDAQDSPSNAGSGEASSDSESKAYEISKSVLDNPQIVLSPIVLGLILLALVVIGYKRKSKDDY